MQHTEPAYPPAPLQGPPPGLLRPRPGLTAGVGFEDPARTLTRRIGRVMSATGPDRMFRFPPQDGIWKTVAGPVAGFARSFATARQRTLDGLRLLPRPHARYARSRKAFLPPGPIRSRSIRQREHGKCGTGAISVDEKGGGGWVRDWNCGGRGEGLYPDSRRLRRPISPLAGEMPDRAEGGMDPDSVFAVSPPSVTYGDISPARGEIGESWLPHRPHD